MHELTTLYAAWINSQHLALASADEVLAEQKLTREQRAWLMAFIALWDATRDLERAQPPQPAKRAKRAQPAQPDTLGRRLAQYFTPED